MKKARHWLSLGNKQVHSSGLTWVRCEIGSWDELVPQLSSGQNYHGKKSKECSWLGKTKLPVSGPTENPRGRGKAKDYPMVYTRCP